MPGRDSVPSLTASSTAKLTDTSDPSMDSTPRSSQPETAKSTAAETITAKPTEDIPSPAETITARPTPREEPSESFTARPTAAPTPREEPTESFTSKPTARPTPHEEPSESFTAKPTSRPTPHEEPSESFTAKPTARPTPREEPSESFTARPTARSTPREEPSESFTARQTARPTPRPTFSALPTRRPTLSSKPTLVFRTQRPAEVLPSRIAATIQIQIRNESLFDNPKNVEAVVKTIVCSLQVEYESVSVDSIAHYRDGLFIRNITLPPKEPARNMTFASVCEATTTAFDHPMRRLQNSGIDTYTLNYAIADPPTTVTSLEPATVASLIETSPVLAISLDIPTNSYIAVTASQPTLITESSAEQQQPVQSAPNGLSNILLGTLIPLGAVLVGSAIVATIRRKQRHSLLPLRAEVHPSAINVDNPITLTTLPDMSKRVLRISNRRITEPTKVRRIGT
jgi:hypothetical protein